MAQGRRVGRKKVRVIGRTWNDVQRDIQEALDELLESNDDGIPPGFRDVTPEEVNAGDEGDPGTATQGWAAADHEHSVETAAPSNATGTAAAEGSGTALMRADATIEQGIVTTKGDLLGHSTDPARVPVGTDGQVLTADSGEALGVKWDDMPDSSGWTDDGTVVRLTDATDQVGIGTATPTAGDSLEVVGAVGLARHDDDAADGATLNFRRSRDTEASPDAVQAGDLIAIIEMMAASDDGNYYPSARIELEAQANFTTGKASNYTSDLIFKMANTSVLAEAMRLKSTGELELSGGLSVGSFTADTLQATNVFQLVPESSGGAHITIDSQSEEVTITAATTDASIQLPDDSLILFVSVFVTETITRATSDITDFDVGDATTAQRFGAGLSRLAGTDDVGMRQWRGSVASDATGPTQAANSNPRITCNGGSGAFTAGKVRITVFYLRCTPPSS